MLKISFLAFLALILVSCRHYISVDQSELRQVFTDLLTADSVKAKYYLIDSIESFDSKSINQSDSLYYIAFCSEVKNGIWTDKIFDSAKIISNEKLHSLSQPDPFIMTPSHYSFSLPYFSKDKQSFLIYYNHYCGNLCAEYSLRLYKKVNGKWTFIKTYFSMVS